MSTALGSLRRLVLAPSLAEVSFAGRGFPITRTPATERLEAIPQAVVCGFEWGIDARGQEEVERRLSLVDAELRGFAYEGATMAFTVLDAMGPRRGTRTRDLLLGPGRPHIFLAYIGIGFAMARLPRPLWKKVLPDLTGSPYYPTMSWLAVDGYGFDLAYFSTDRWVDQQRIPAPYSWAGAPDYFPRAVDQGIGRALWFIHGANVPAVAAAVGRFPEQRRPDLWSGVGLAATFAGGCDPAALAALRREAGTRHPELAQGVVFAARARSYSGSVPEHTTAAVRVLTDLSVEAATRLADDGAVEPGTAGPVPDYELWRRRVQAHFTSADDKLAATS
jgi:enediyne biosynthesis protein E2